MAGDWLKFEINTPEKPEVLSITVDMGWDDPDLTVGKLLRLWRWFDQHTEDGNATNVTEALLDRIVGVTGFCKAMANVGWLIIDDAGITLPNFDHHNGKTAKSRSLTAKRVANHKSNAKGNAEGNANTVTEALPREEKRREDIKDKEKEIKETASPSAPPAKPKSNGSRLPDNFQVPDDWMDWAASERKDIPIAELPSIAAGFTDYWAAKAGASARKVSWEATWRNWIRNHRQSAGPPANRNQKYDPKSAWTKINQGLSNDNTIDIDPSLAYQE